MINQTFGHIYLSSILELGGRVHQLVNFETQVFVRILKSSKAEFGWYLDGKLIHVLPSEDCCESAKK